MSELIKIKEKSMPDVKCHKCGLFYDCPLGKEQGLCAYCSTKFAISLSPGSQIKDDNGVIWIRMQDSIDYHLEGFFFNPIDGSYKHASKVLYRL